jgi:hypothetical protein
MRDLEKYQAVNSAETFEDLKSAIMVCANEDGSIDGREQMFDAKRMCEGLDLYVMDLAPPNVLTRKWGIRQQAMYLKYYVAEETQQPIKTC